MPFDERFSDVYQIGIRESCEAAGAYCERVDEQIFQERILDRIYNQIAKADLVIADMTGRNPNVFYEVGYAHALDKCVILLTQKAEDIPFDLKHFPHIVYGDKLVDLRDSLTKKLKWFIDNPPVTRDSTRDDLEVFIKGSAIVEGVPAVFEFDGSYYPHVEVTIHNLAPKVLLPEMICIGFILDNSVPSPLNEDVLTTKLPDGRMLHIMPKLPSLFPDQFVSVGLSFPFFQDCKAGFQAVLRLYSELGPRDFPIDVRQKADGESQK